MWEIYGVFCAAFLAFLWFWRDFPTRAKKEGESRNEMEYNVDTCNRIWTKNYSEIYTITHTDKLLEEIGYQVEEFKRKTQFTFI